MNIKEPSNISVIQVICPHCGKSLRMEFQKPMSKRKVRKLFKPGPAEKIFSMEEVQNEFDKRRCERYAEHHQECEAEECNGYNTKCEFYEVNQ